MRRSRILVGLTATALALPLGGVAASATATPSSTGMVSMAQGGPPEGRGGDSAPDITPNVGIGPVISGDGSFVAFESIAGLMAEDTNTRVSTCTSDPKDGSRPGKVSGTVAMPDIYRYEMAGGALDRPSKANEGGTEAQGFKIDGHTGLCVPATNGSDPAIDEDGDYVAFTSGGNVTGRTVEAESEDTGTAATDGTAIEPNVYRNGGSPRTTSWASDDGGSAGRELPAISADGRYVVMVGRSKTAAGVYVKDMDSPEVPAKMVAAGFLFNPAISADGSTVAWAKYGSESTGGQNIYVLDWQNPTAAPELVSRSDDGVPADGVTDFPSLSADGNLVAFQSMDKTLDKDVAPGASGGGPNKAYVRDRAAGTTEMVSVVDDEGGDQMINGQGLKPDITPDGRYVAFASDATALQSIESETEESTFQQVYVRDRQEQTTYPVSVALGGTGFGDGASSPIYGPSISDDGNVVAFESDAANLVEGDTNGDTDAFVHDMTTGVTTRVSLDENGAQVDLSPDSTKPQSGAKGNPYTHRDRYQVRYTAEDPGWPALGVMQVDLYVKKPGQSTFTMRQSDVGGKIDNAFTVTSPRDGKYRFYTVATDLVGNVESTSGTADFTMIRDTVRPRITNARVNPGSFDVSRDHRATFRMRISERANTTFRIKHDGIVIKHFAVKASTRGLVTQAWFGRNDAGRMIHSGRYVVVMKATDRAGNITLVRSSLHAQR